MLSFCACNHCLSEKKMKVIRLCLQQPCQRSQQMGPPESPGATSDATVMFGSGALSRGEEGPAGDLRRQ